MKKAIPVFILILIVGYFIFEDLDRSKRSLSTNLEIGGYKWEIELPKGYRYTGDEFYERLSKKINQAQFSQFDEYDIEFAAALNQQNILIVARRKFDSQEEYDEYIKQLRNGFENFKDVFTGLRKESDPNFQMNTSERLDTIDNLQFMRFETAYSMSSLKSKTISLHRLFDMEDLCIQITTSSLEDTPVVEAIQNSRFKNRFSIFSD